MTQGPYGNHMELGDFGALVQNSNCFNLWPVDTAYTKGQAKKWPFLFSERDGFCLLPSLPLVETCEYQHIVCPLAGVLKGNTEPCTGFMSADSWK